MTIGTARKLARIIKNLDFLNLELGGGFSETRNWMFRELDKGGYQLEFSSYRVERKQKKGTQ